LGIASNIWTERKFNAGGFYLQKLAGGENRNLSAASSIMKTLSHHTTSKFLDLAKQQLNIDVERKKRGLTLDK